PHYNPPPPPPPPPPPAVPGGAAAAPGGSFLFDPTSANRQKTSDRVVTDLVNAKSAPILRG
ncbi:MAG: hypothetical protein OXI96_02495, partial [Acidimicrobiaceae bacterium]|nr:hypothetical protein [Acidimicrobiaceae bacterium]